MKKIKELIIRKYPNRRLYDVELSSYITLEDLSQLVRDKRDFKVIDTATGKDITRSVLTQIIFNQESKGSGIMHIDFLKNIIQLYDSSARTLVPGYLDYCIKTFWQETSQNLTNSVDNFSNGLLGVFEKQTKDNFKAYQKVMNISSLLKDENNIQDKQNIDKESIEDNSLVKENNQYLMAEIENIREEISDLSKLVTSIMNKKITKIENK